jgi:hypothetical protein
MQIDLTPPQMQMIDLPPRPIAATKPAEHP